MAPSNQSRITSFISSSKQRHHKVQRHSSVSKGRRSSFEQCPICYLSFPSYRLAQHASNCNGEAPKRDPVPAKEFRKPSSEPLPGLCLYEDFISEEEEATILAQLDGKDPNFATEFLPWKPNTFNGKHSGKRWGVHCNLRERKVTPAEDPLPSFLTQIVLPRLRKNIRSLQQCRPNEANAIDYHTMRNDYLKAHVDDRQLSTEPIANMSLAGDCYMTFRNERHTSAPPKKVLLKRRCLQVLTGPARYDYSHGIAAEDLLSPRRVSVTMRESPLTSVAVPKSRQK